MKLHIPTFARNVAKQILRASDYDPFYQQFRLTSSVPNPVIFDVGAHYGETAEIYTNLFKGTGAKIYSFEPFPESFSILKDKMAGKPSVFPVNLALSDREGETVMSSNVSSSTNSLLPTHETAIEIWKSGLLNSTGNITVKMTTLDSFAASVGLEKIDILKLDTQGTELTILKGAKELLSQGKIKMIYTEIITVDAYEGQFKMHEILSYLAGFDFVLHGFYNYSFAKETGRMRQIDALLVNQELLKK